MRFGNWQMIYWLWAVLAFGLFLFWARAKKQKAMERFAEKKLLENISMGVNPAKEVRQIILLILSGVFAVAALMRPQLGFEWQEVKRKGADIIVALDTSKSMLTQDIKPNRLERSKWAIRDLVKKLKGDRIGLIAFSGSAFLVCPLTVDYHGFLLTLDNVDEKTVSLGGTSIASSIKEAIKDYKNAKGKYKALVIITDGEDMEGNTEGAADEARKEGINIYAIGVGTKEGELIQVKNDNGQNEFLKDRDGNFVKSRLNEPLLEKIALATDGAYVKASGAEFGLELIYDTKLSRAEKKEIESKMEKRYFDRFQIPLLISLIFLILATVLEAGK
ncbi:MAG: VWA domain-containing protein [Candidatus Omnitrophica bacterium]|nr:VWA domain-containing protein [Candidatus Omnitrophota bacterium]